MKLEVTLLSEPPRTFKLKGRRGQTLYHLHKAGPLGITALEAPAIRLAAYVHALRELGFNIITEREPHGGDYPGHHARYKLACAVKIGLGKGGALDDA